MWRKKVVVLCPTCSGRGYQIEHDVTDYHRNEYNVINTKCRRCDGMGRLWETTTKEYEKLSTFSKDHDPAGV